MTNLAELKVLTTQGDLLAQEREALILPSFSGEPLSGGAAAADSALGGLLSEMRQRGEFRADLYESAVVPTLGRLPAGRLQLLGLGKREDFGRPQCCRVVSAACRALASRQLRHAALDL